MTIGSGIAIAGMWAAVAAATWAVPPVGFIGVIGAAFGTIVIAAADAGGGGRRGRG